MRNKDLFDIIYALRDLTRTPHKKKTYIAWSNLIYQDIETKAFNLFDLRKAVIKIKRFKDINDLSYGLLYEVAVEIAKHRLMVSKIRCPFCEHVMDVEISYLLSNELSDSSHCICGKTLLDIKENYKGDEEMAYHFSEELKTKKEIQKVEYWALKT